MASSLRVGNCRRPTLDRERMLARHPSGRPARFPDVGHRRDERRDRERLSRFLMLLELSLTSGAASRPGRPQQAQPLRSKSCNHEVSSGPLNRIEQRGRNQNNIENQKVSTTGSDRGVPYPRLSQGIEASLFALSQTYPPGHHSLWLFRLQIATVRGRIWTLACCNRHQDTSDHLCTVPNSTPTHNPNANHGAGDYSNLCSGSAICFCRAFLDRDIATLLVQTFSP